jgi:hypothetical protein
VLGEEISSWIGKATAYKGLDIRFPMFKEYTSGRGIDVTMFSATKKMDPVEKLSKDEPTDTSELAK